MQLAKKEAYLFNVQSRSCTQTTDNSRVKEKCALGVRHKSIAKLIYDVEIP